MEEPAEERRRAYIAQRVPRIRAQIKRTKAVAACGYLCAFLLLVLGDSVGIAVAISLLTFFGQASTVAILNLHIDHLSNASRDLDRDMALDLPEFELPTGTEERRAPT